MENYTYTEKKGKNHLEYRYRWMNGVEIRDNRENLDANYLYMEIWNNENDEVTYKNSWITDKMIDRSNVKHLSECARSRWKIENEHNNVLKN
ncbi:hypothetical protein AGMMS49992_13660 [Clostridia bacterium]|nr:hypothetical protein AGMMS49992_13660 [Clostridia bacterium]